MFIGYNVEVCDGRRTRRYAYVVRGLVVEVLCHRPQMTDNAISRHQTFEFAPKQRLLYYRTPQHHQCVLINTNIPLPYLIQGRCNSRVRASISILALIVRAQVLIIKKSVVRETSTEHQCSSGLNSASILGNYFDVRWSKRRNRM